MDLLPQPDIVRCFFEKQFQPHLPAMELRWDPEAPGVEERTWYFPGHLTFKGPPPHHFGVTLERHAVDRYQVRILWNDLCLAWTNLRRTEILTSALSPVLRALGTDLWYLLEQPIAGESALAKVA